MSVADELEIRNLVARYVDAVNDRDEAAWQSTWCDDATWELMGQRLEGTEACLGFLRAAFGSLEAVIQQATGGVIEIDGDEATGRWTISEHAKTTDGTTMLLIGSYSDRYLRTGDGWRFAHRGLVTLYQGPPDLSGHFRKP